MEREGRSTMIFNTRSSSHPRELHDGPVRSIPLSHRGTVRGGVREEPSHRGTVRGGVREGRTVSQKLVS
jgi:hypothetical protein